MKEKFLFFIDILGVSSLSTNNEWETIKTIHNVVIEGKKNLKQINLDIFLISDTIIITTDVSLDGINNIIDLSSKLIWEVIDYGFFARGSLVKGFCASVDDAVSIYGPAVNLASSLEKLARNPRFIVHKSVYEDKFYLDCLYKQICFVDYDNQVCMNYMHTPSSLYDKWFNEHGIVASSECPKEILEEILKLDYIERNMYIRSATIKKCIFNYYDNYKNSTMNLSVLKKHDYVINYNKKTNSKFDIKIFDTEGWRRQIENYVDEHNKNIVKL